ncbi:MAG: Xaa-Pro peptidase family protein [Vicinamibacterales bacterium]
MSHAPADALRQRHQGIRAELAARQLDALVVTSLPNVLYLTNFTGSTAVVVLTAAGLHFLTDFRYVTVMNEVRDTPYGCPDLELVTVDGSYDGALAKLLGSLKLGRVGFEGAHVTVSRHAWLADVLARERAGAAPSLIATEGLVERARLYKDEYEVRTLREAARRLSVVAEAVLGDVRAGRTEREMALAIDWRIRQGGFERSAFETIVASGPNGARPHARPGERMFSEGDVVVLDFGGVYDSYCVDLTRTVSVGRASGRAREVYDAVREAHDSAIRAVAPGRSRFDIDAAARRVLGERGLAEAFGHGTGHGLGIEIHEDPRIARRRPDADTRDENVAPGMVFTIEPGAYLPDWGGVRIEDDVLVTQSGVEVLTDVTTELLEV